MPDTYQNMSAWIALSSDCTPQPSLFYLRYGAGFCGYCTSHAHTSSSGSADLRSAMKKRRKIKILVSILAFPVLVWLLYRLRSDNSAKDENWAIELANINSALSNRRPANGTEEERSVHLIEEKSNSEQEQNLQQDNHLVKQGLKANLDSIKDSYSLYPLTWSASLSLDVSPNDIREPVSRKTIGTAFNFISAYYDDRSHPSIVVLGYDRFRDTESVQPVYCLYRYADSDIERCSTVPCARLQMDACNVFKEFNHGELYLYVHSFYVCRLSDSGRIPVAVRMSTSATCDPSTTLIPVYNQSKHTLVKADIGICVQTPVFKSSLNRLVSFIEMNRLLGIDVFTAYFIATDSTHNIMDFLRNKYGDVFDVVVWNPVFSLDKSILHYHGEILAINDCLYRNIGRVNYLLFIDLDELIVAERHDNLKDMLKEIDTGSHLDSFVFRNFIFMESKVQPLKKTITKWRNDLCCEAQLPIYLFHFNRVNCNFKYFTRSKLIVKPFHIKDIDIHGVCKRISNTTTHMLVPLEIGFLHHYRAKPTTECHKNPSTHVFDATVDTAMDKYAHRLINAINTVMSST